MPDRRSRVRRTATTDRRPTELGGPRDPLDRRHLRLPLPLRLQRQRRGRSAALRAGSDLDVRFVPFSLDQVHVEEGEPPVWEREPDEWGTGMLALLYGIAVRDAFPDQFFDAHLALFAARHDHGLKLGHEDVLARRGRRRPASTPTRSPRRPRAAAR